ncbi:ribonuclease III [Ruania alba]|uniref:Ribonuclease 3 n=1 Tax=Ruania alba TaxID=648782 RepID=A0A1H5HDP7_9MICO|nr:ribonuclease III [Ruania alba]SEE26112.1 RNAse III [Ruania alba]
MSAPGVDALIEALGIDVDPELLVLSLTHRSFAHEAGGIPTNERLEFLGDAVLGIIVTEHLYRTHPDNSEGDLAKMRSATVSQRALSAVARELGLGEYLLLGRGERGTGGHDKDSILCDTMEAVIGAVYLCHGLEPTRTFVERLVGPTLESAAGLGAGLDWKTSVQELAAARSVGAPTYQVDSSGPDHERHFTATLYLGERAWGVGDGTSKKIAEQRAAENAYRALEADEATASASTDQ